MFHTDTNGPYPGSSSPKSQRDYSRFSEDPASPLSPDFYPLTDSFNVPSSTAPDTVMDGESSYNCETYNMTKCLFKVLSEKVTERLVIIYVLK